MSTDNYPEDYRPAPAAERVKLPGIFLLVIGIINLFVGVDLMVESVRYMRMDDMALKAHFDDVWTQMPENLKDLLKGQGVTKDRLAEQTRLLAPYYLGWSIVTVLFALISSLGGWR